MDLLSSIFYGVVQGLTEFLPISSSGHLALFQIFFGMNGEENIAFNVLLHLGTLLAVFAMYYKDIFALVPAFFTMLKKVFTGKFKLSDYTVNERMVILLIIATLPLVVIVKFADAVEYISTYAVIIGAILIFNGLVLMLSDNISKKSRDKIGIEKATPKKALFVGICQMFAVVPGLSRSGSTITGGLLMNFDREFAVKFSFIMSIPAILGASILELPVLFEGTTTKTEIGIYIVGALTAAVVGFCAMKLLTYISKRHSFKIFSYYCFAIGAAAIIWWIIKSF